MALLADIIMRDTRANQPAAATEGRLYYVTDENVTERDSGVAWEDVSDAGTGGGGGTPTAVGARVKRASGNVTAASGGSGTAIAFTAEDFDTDAFHDNSTDNTKLIVPSGKAGVYIFGGGFYADANCDINVLLNGTTNIAFGRAGGGDSSVVSYTISGAYQLAVGDYLEVIATGRGGTKTVYFDASQASPHFWTLLVGT